MINSPSLTVMMELSAQDIRWHLEPFTPEPADDDPLVASILDGLAYRLVLTQGLAALHDLHRRYDRLREAHQHLAAEYRALREKTMVEAAR